MTLLEIILPVHLLNFITIQSFPSEKSAITGKLENWEKEAVVELMCNCLSFDFDFRLSFMFQGQR